MTRHGHVVCLRGLGRAIRTSRRLASGALASARRLEIARTNIEERGRRPRALPHRNIGNLLRFNPFSTEMQFTVTSRLNIVLVDTAFGSVIVWVLLLLTPAMIVVRYRTLALPRIFIWITPGFIHQTNINVGSKISPESNCANTLCCTYTYICRKI